MRDKPVFSSERMLRKGHNRKSSGATQNLVVILKELGAKTNWLAVNRKS
jgi:glucan phosphoethanolaminetransferase (alkaline phosphatase superfamily)